MENSTGWADIIETRPQSSLAILQRGKLRPGSAAVTCLAEGHGAE